MTALGYCSLLALEGPSLAGKTSLARRIAAGARFKVLREYTDEVNDAPYPDQPSRESQLASFRFFLTLEERRCQIVEQTLSGSPILLDRSIDTLLAHAFALDIVRSLGCYPAVREELRHHRYLVPDLTVFLDVSADEVFRRASLGVPRPRLLVCPEYIAAFRKYFVQEPIIAKRCRFLDPDNAADLILTSDDFIQ
jgi:deoxyadenosine/deoxycytidine kinase